MHRHRYLKEKDPVKYTFYATRGNAKRRGKEWGISLEEFRQWCEETGYMNVKGRKPESGTIERKNNNFGYFIWNIEILSLSLNSSKGNKEEDPF